MKYLILVICSYLFFVSCFSPPKIEEQLEFPIDISEIYDDLSHSAKNPFWGGPIRVVESGSLVSFQVTGSKDLFIVDTKSGDFEKLYPNPPDTIGGMVYRYAPVGFVFPHKSGFSYLKNESQLIHIGVSSSKDDTLLLAGEILSAPSKILHISDKSMISYWYGSSAKENPSKRSVFFTDLEKNSTNRIISEAEFENLADLVAVDEKIYILEKYRSVIHVFDFKGTEIKTIYLPKSNYLKYQKLERPTGFLKLPPEEKVLFLEDYCLDMTQQGDTTAFLHLTYSGENQSLTEDYVLSIFFEGKLQEQILDFKPLNFSPNGEIYFMNETDSGKFLEKKPFSQLF